MVFVNGNMDRPKPSAYADFIRTKDPGNNNSRSSRSSSFHGSFHNNNNNSHSSRSSTSYVEFMRNNDPNHNNYNNNNSHSSRSSSYRSNPSRKPHNPSVAAASLNNENNNNNDRHSQHSTAMYAVGSHSSSSASERSHSHRSSSNHNQRRRQQHQHHHSHSHHHSHAASPQYSNASRYQDDSYYAYHHDDDDDDHYLLQRKDPPRYDSRPNLKNDLSDSYQPYNEQPQQSQSQQESNKATHVRSNYQDSTNSNTVTKSHPLQLQQQPHRLEPLRDHHHHNNNNNNTTTTSIHPKTQHTLRNANTSNQYNTARKLAPATTNVIRPCPRAGKPPCLTPVPVCPGLPSRLLQSRGLLLGRNASKHLQASANAIGIPQQPHASSPTDIPSLGSSSHSNTCCPILQQQQQQQQQCCDTDPGPLEGLSPTMTVECKGCGGLVQGISKNAIALECPNCQKFYPTVTCKVVQ